MSDVSLAPIQAICRRIHADQVETSQDLSVISFRFCMMGVRSDFICWNTSAVDSQNFSNARSSNAEHVIRADNNARSEVESRV